LRLPRFFPPRITFQPPNLRGLILLAAAMMRDAVLPSSPMAARISADLIPDPPRLGHEQ
jgi:hypothetical protein